MVTPTPSERKPTESSGFDSRLVPPSVVHFLRRDHFGRRYDLITPPFPLQVPLALRTTVGSGVAAVE